MLILGGSLYINLSPNYDEQTKSCLLITLRYSIFFCTILFKDKKTNKIHTQKISQNAHMNLLLRGHK